MLFGIGVDIVEISRFQRLMDRYGERFAQRLLTPGEYEQFRRRHFSLKFLATRFAAKEAASKAMGTGLSQGISFKSIEVENDEHGKPLLRFHGIAAQFIENNRIHQSLLSLSDEKHYAVAMVVLERNIQN
jgi:holo-[acyl-carrier protein] synthase